MDERLTLLQRIHDDLFMRGYEEAAIWSETCKSQDADGIETEDHDVPIDREHDRTDLTVRALRAIVEDCERFQRENATALALAYERYAPSECSPIEQAGHDFLLTRNGHGAGFWDRGLDDLGEELTEAAHRFPEWNLYVTDSDEVDSM